MKRLLVLGSVFVFMACGGGKTEDAKSPDGDVKTDKPSEEQATVAAMGEAFFLACEGKAAGDACDAIVNDGEREKALAGKCTQPPAESKEQRVVCLPNDLPQ